jgi:hypothetical protein
MKRLQTVLWLTFLPLLLGGCVSVNKSVLDHSFSQRVVPAQEVQVFFSNDEIPDHTRVAILNASGDSGFTNQGQMIDKLREQAGRLGANAIILDEVREPSTGEKAVNALLGGFATGQRRAAAIAIYVGR